MTFDEAVQLAQRIRDHYSRLQVVAIGRFIPVPEFDTTPECWGVSVRVDGEHMKRFWAAEDAVYYADAAPPKRPAARKPKPVEATGEPMLF